MKKIIELKNVTKAFDGQVVLDHINLDIYDNEFLTLLGPSGCGKTTTLRLIGGFEQADEGDIIDQRCSCSQEKCQYGIPEICSVPAPQCI